MTTSSTLAPTPLAPDAEDRWMPLAHLAGLLSFLGPLGVWIAFRHRSDVVEREAREALQAQATMAALAIVLHVVGATISVGPLAVVGGLVVLVAMLVQLAALVLAVVGGLRVGAQGAFRYPFAVRLMR
jgi:uncharacterized Tic20 family protein